jgi:hypothetical protein
MWKDSAVTEIPKATAPAVTAKPVTEDELRTILDRLESTRDIFRENRELRDVLSRRIRDPGIASPQRGVGRHHAEIRPDAAECGNDHGIGGKNGNARCAE